MIKTWKDNHITTMELPSDHEINWVVLKPTQEGERNIVVPDGWVLDYVSITMTMEGFFKQLSSLDALPPGKTSDQQNRYAVLLGEMILRPGSTKQELLKRLPTESEESLDRMLKVLWSARRAYSKSDAWYVGRSVGVEQDNYRRGLGEGVSESHRVTKSEPPESEIVAGSRKKPTTPRLFENEPKPKA